MAADQLRIDIEKMIRYAKDDLLSRTCCIYKVRRSIRKQNEYIYTPTTISIGPFHHGDERLEDMETHKVIMLKRFTQRTMRMTSLDDLISFARDLEPKVRASYSEDTTDLSEHEFQKLLLLDGAFVVELFWSLYDWTGDKTELDAILRQPKLFSDIKKDLLLLENQLPFFFLEGLYQKAFPDHDMMPSFIQLSYMFFGSYNIQHLQPDPDVRLSHFTDLLRLFHLPTSLPRRESWLGHDDDILLYSAKQLAEVDLRFKATGSPCPLDLEFSDNVLAVPRILVGNDTAVLFHNMITFEQYHYPNEPYLCDYALLLDCLINSHEDVNVLISNGIIQNSLGDPLDVVRIFDGLSTNLSLLSFNSDYSKICNALNSMGSDPWRQIKRAVKRQLLLSITGFILNVLTLIQTVFSILQVVGR